MRNKKELSIRFYLKKEIFKNTSSISLFMCIISLGLLIFSWVTKKFADVFWIQVLCFTIFFLIFIVNSIFLIHYEKKLGKMEDQHE